MPKENQLVRAYSEYKELFHVIGFLILLIFSLGGLWDRWQAQAADIDDLKSRTNRLELVNAQVLQSLVDIKDYLHVPSRR